MRLRVAGRHLLEESAEVGEVAAAHVLLLRLVRVSARARARARARVRARVRVRVRCPPPSACNLVSRDPCRLLMSDRCSAGRSLASLGSRT